MADSNSSGVKHRTYKEIAEIPVTWGKLLTIFAAVGGVLTTVTLFVWGNDNAHEASQTALILQKADKADLSASVDKVAQEVRLLRADVNALVMKLIKVAEVGPIGPGQAQAQRQDMHMHQDDWFGRIVSQQAERMRQERLASKNKE